MAKPKSEQGGLELLRRGLELGMPIAEACKAARALEGLSQQEFAEFVGLSPRVIKDIERGKGNPRLDSIEKIAQAMGLQVVIAKPAANFSVVDAKQLRKEEAAARVRYFEQVDASADGGRAVHEANAVDFSGVSYQLPKISK